MPSSAQPLSPVEQLVFTNGACDIFLAAVEQLVPGKCMVLRATDPRHLRLHDWPEDEPLELHVFLQLPSGDVLDAEGTRSLDALLKGFGVRQGWKYQIGSTGVKEAQRAPPLLVERLKHRLEELGWGPEHLPVAQNLFEDKQVFQRVCTETQAWWNQWTAEAPLASETQEASIPEAPKRKAPRP